MARKPLAIIAGAGPGLGEGLLRALEAEGYTAFGIRRHAKPDHPRIIGADLSDEGQTRQAVAGLLAAHGAPSLVIHNAAELVMGPFLETRPEAFAASWRAGVLSAVHLAQALLPAMVSAGEGTLIFSGATASLRGSAGFSAFSSAKAGLRALSQSLAREYGPKGIHVAHVILDGIIDTAASRRLHGLEPGRMMQPEDIAASYIALARQPKSAWTFEMDLRPMGEKF